MTLALVLLALWVLLLLPVLALCKAAALGDQISASLQVRVERDHVGEDISSAVGIGAGTSYEGQKVRSFRSVRHGE